MAFFIVHANLSPTEYNELTLVQRESLIEAIKTKG